VLEPGPMYICTAGCDLLMLLQDRSISRGDRR
jgi:hypothetical protein